MTHAHHECDCGHRIPAPSRTFPVTALTCGMCNKTYSISFNPSKLLGVFSEWRCSTCNSDKGTWFKGIRGCKTLRD